jgi:hypothetical protein
VNSATAHPKASLGMPRAKVRNFASFFVMAFGQAVMFFELLDLGGMISPKVLRLFGYALQASRLKILKRFHVAKR